MVGSAGSGCSPSPPASTPLTPQRTILFLGCVQSIIESCMYIFVFLWTPVLSGDSAPLGMIFSCFMVAIMIGASGFSLLLSPTRKPEDIIYYATVIFGACTAACSLIERSDPLLPEV